MSFSYYYHYYKLSLVFYFIDLLREQLKNENYEGDIDQMVKSLPAYLSDRALDLGGGRSTSSRAKHSKKYKDKNILQRSIKISDFTKNINKKALQFLVIIL